jgi:hypothetical protein
MERPSRLRSACEQQHVSDVVAPGHLGCAFKPDGIAGDVEVARLAIASAEHETDDLAG